MWPHAIAAVLVLFGAVVASAPASAHSTSTTFLAIDATDDAPRLQWDISLLDLQWTIDLDVDGDGAITWSEVQTRRGPIERFALDHLQLRRGDQPCVIRAARFEPITREEDPHVSLGLAASCEAVGALEVRSTLFFVDDEAQRVLLQVRRGAQVTNTVLSPRSPSWTEPATPSAWREFGRFVWQGAWHVWIGYDHLAFIALLLLPAVLRPGGRAWVNAGSARSVLFEVLKIVTVFTLAHSITLALAVTGALVLPSRPVELVIAASIVIAGLMNLRPQWSRARVAVAGAFGLVHGLGFANALSELGSSGVRLLPLLGGFNVGVELAQLAVVLALLPVLLMWRRSGLYATRVMPAASLAIGLIGAFWFVQRLGA
jgi:hypothetical protein